jgi:hypothetical protein
MTVPKTTVTFLVLGFAFLFLSMQPGAALSEINMEREISGNVANDKEALLKLDGFANDVYRVGEEYTATGSITNDTDLSLQLNVIIMPHGVFKKNGWYKIKIGDACCVFGKKSVDSKDAVLTKRMSLCLAPGQTVDVRSAMTKAMTGIMAIEFGISAVDSTDTVSCNLEHTAYTPRLFYCRSRIPMQSKKGMEADKTESTGNQPESAGDQPCG